MNPIEEITKDILCAYLSDDTFPSIAKSDTGEAEGNYIAKMYEIIYKKVFELNQST